MKLRSQLSALFLALSLTTGIAFAGGKAQTYTGKVSDAMCGAHHMMEGSDADCARACIGKGSKYALVSGEKVYILQSSDKSALASLDKLVGTDAKVTGTLDGNTVQVASVAAAK
ncbi:MAG TPA: hypothetical protein VK466_18035 [Terriglobales bacterium]|nr:hypothetical protein [Terriglobales bacterium]